MMTQSEAQAELVGLLKEDNWFEDFEGLKIIQDNGWTQDHKYQNREIVVEFKGHLFEIQENRSGSYHTDWYYGDIEVYPVERHEETKVIVSYPANGPSTTVPGRY